GGRRAEVIRARSIRAPGRRVSRRRDAPVSAIGRLRRRDRDFDSLAQFQRRWRREGYLDRKHPRVDLFARVIGADTAADEGIGVVYPLACPQFPPLSTRPALARSRVD